MLRTLLHNVYRDWRRVQALAAAQDSEAGWQQRAQSSLAHSEHLTQLLSESACWPSESGESGEADGPHHRLDGAKRTHHDAQQALLAEQARAAHLQLQVWPVHDAVC